MKTKKPEALRIAEWLAGIRGNTWPSYIPQEAAAELCRQHAEIEQLRAGYSAARLEIESLKERVQQLGQLARGVNSRRVTELEAQLAAVGADGVEPLRKRECLHQISEPAQPVGWAIFAENGNGLMWTQSRQNAEATAKDIGLQVTPLYAAPQSAAPAQAGENEFVSRAGWVESAMRVYLIAGDTEKEARECAEHLWSEADMDDLPDPIGAAMEDCEGRGAAKAAPVEAQHSTACLYHYALSRLGLRDNTGLRVLFWDAHNSLSWDSKTDWYVTPDADEADCGLCNAARAAQGAKHD